MIFVVFSMTIKNSHFCFCPNSNADIFVFIGYLNLKDLSGEWSPMIVKAMFA